MKPLDRRSFLKLTAASVAMGPFAELLAQPRTERPNVLFLFSDDQRFDTIAALGNGVVRTPNLDRLVSMGTSFTHAYIMGGSCPAVCSPSRAALFTGLTLWNLENQGPYGFEMSDKYTTLPQVFKENGYVTFGTGKNAPGQRDFNRSFSEGSQLFFRGMSGHYRLRLHDYSDTGKYTKDQIKVLKDKHSSEVYADATIDFLQRHKDSSQPFFAYVSFQAPHDPRQCPEEYRAMYQDDQMPLPESYMPEHPFDNGMLKIRDEMLARHPRQKDEIRKHLADYYGIITHMDAQIGRILQTLEATGKLDNTIIVFTSDNGLAIGRHGLMGKQNVYDHAVHVPFIVAGPGIPKGQKRDQLCYIYDIYPTLCDLAGLTTPRTVQYKSLTRVIDDPHAEHRDHLYFAFMSWQRSVRDKRHKLIEYCVKGQRHTQLFDLVEDPDELKNLAGDPKHAAVLAKLRKLLEAERVRRNDGNTRYPHTNQQGKDFWETYESVAESVIP